MSLFSFGLTKANNGAGKELKTSTEKPLPSYISEQMESGLGWEQHETVASVVVDLTNPEPKAKRRKIRGKYGKYLTSIVQQ